MFREFALVSKTRFIKVNAVFSSPSEFWMGSVFYFTVSHDILIVPLLFTSSHIYLLELEKWGKNPWYSFTVDD